ncbi:DUF3159 domain-containing protein [Fodinicola feengrottensis]|uniref:DUF3159 domain-containing protein n=1 Tax=Fodinicola feengrottensis TaxID=435914 RepID=A0ABN2J409_9ACTN
MTPGESRLEKPTESEAVPATDESGGKPNLDDISIKEYFSTGEFRREVARQVGGWTGIAESAIPVIVFVAVNTFTSLYPALIAAVASSLVIGAFRLIRKQSPRQAINGLFGIAVAAIYAAKTGKAVDFYLPGILISYAYAVVIAGSLLFRRPLVGAVWAFFGNIGTEWRKERRLFRMFSWLTVLWAVVWIAKVTVQAWMYLAGFSATELGIARIILGTPPIVLLIAVTAWCVQRSNARQTVTSDPDQDPAS